jgi:hypothetical protein
LKKTFAHVDNELAKAWHATAKESMKAGKDASNALKKASENHGHPLAAKRRMSGSMTSAMESRISNKNFERSKRIAVRSKQSWIPDFFLPTGSH